ncbi:hypothetical protein [Fimbriiglobus ruber]|uniref:Uncharacterized protein n=1 Tax=Fimbriiglobus ruber TaxID=1908690 RepID=A0A225DS80_9BACT|nr:hypothetical protein [Fimbriiglobus ruber]OWK38933.1 hypothetical protein FRUB_06309 [Fimbriiglobus ruber]OWK38967.1 hypothetical protein FRUB_06343 [Fimbriiglobus ruber]
MKTILYASSHCGLSDFLAIGFSALVDKATALFNPRTQSVLDVVPSSNSWEPTEERKVSLSPGRDILDYYVPDLTHV